MADNKMNDEQIQKEVAKYNTKVDGLTNKFLAKMRGFLSDKKNRVTQIDKTVVNLHQQKERTVSDIDRINEVIDKTSKGSGV